MTKISKKSTELLKISKPFINQTVSLSQVKDYLLLYSPLLVALVVMLPRLRSPQFGMLDDGLILLVAQRAREDWLVAFRFTEELEKFFLESQGGRFLPAFWLFHTLVYQMIGPDPFLAFLVNWAMLTGFTAGLIWLVRFRGGRKIQAWAAGLLFVLSGPIIENFYTLGKTEPPQLLWIGLSLLIMTRYPRVRRRRQRILLVLAGAAAIFLAAMTKETTFVLIPISLGWVLAGWLKIDGASSRNLPARWAYLVASMIPPGLFFSLRALFVPVSLTGGSNTGAYRLTLQTMVATVSQGTGWLLRDFIYLLPLVVLMLLLAFFKKQPQTRLILDSMIWVGGWLVIYLPWHLQLEYYLLPVAVGVAILGGLGFGQALASLKLHRQSFLRPLAGVCLALALILWSPLPANNLTNARLQTAIDQANADFLDFTTTLPSHSHIVLNLARINEYVIKTEPLLAITRDRPDLHLDYFEFQTASFDEPELTYYVAAPQIENQTLPAVRVAVDEASIVSWNEALSDFLEPQAELIYQTEQQVKRLTVGLDRLSCPFFRWVGEEGLFCSRRQPIVAAQTFSYGWKVFRVSSRLAEMALPAVFLPEGRWRFQQTDGLVKEIKFGQAGDVPLVGDWNGDGFSEIGLFRPANQTWYLDNNLDGTSDIEFQFTGMKPTDIPFAGDWDGNGVSTPGYFRPEDRSWRFRNSNSRGGEDTSVIQLGLSTSIPLIGDWNGNGRDTIGSYQPADGRVELWNSPTEYTMFLGPPHAFPVVADWTGYGNDSLAFVKRGQWTRRFINCNCVASNPGEPFDFPRPDQSIPLAGRWRFSR